MSGVVGKPDHCHAIGIEQHSGGDGAAWMAGKSDHAFFEILDNIRVRNLADGIAFIGRCVNRPRAEYAFVVDDSNELWSFLLRERNAKSQTLAGCVLPDQMLRRLYRRCQMDGINSDVIHQEIDREIARSIGSFRALNMPRQQFVYLPDLNGLQMYLQQSLEQKLPGRNILIFGPSGRVSLDLISGGDLSELIRVREHLAEVVAHCYVPGMRDHFLPLVYGLLLIIQFFAMLAVVLQYELILLISASSIFNCFSAFSSWDA